MKISPKFALVLAVGMLITGSINTISTKLADIQNVTGTSTAFGGKPHPFSHPFFQAALMFLGESLCLLTFWSKRAWCDKKTPTRQPLLSAGTRPRSASVAAQQWHPVIFLLPACCDMTGTSLMYVGLNLTHASVFQMLRGSVILFTGIFSVVFLGRKLYAFHWIGMMLVLFGSKFIHIVFHRCLGTCLGFSCAHGFFG